MRLRLLPLMAALVALGLSGVFAYIVHENHIRQAEERLQVAAQRIQQQMAGHVLALRAIKGAFAAARTVPGRQFLSDVIAAFPEQGGAGGAQGYGFAMAATPDSPGPVSSRLMRDYGVDRQPWPATTQTRRFPIVLLEPDDERNRRALGYDMFADPIRWEAMDSAVRTGAPSISRPVELVQENETGAKQRGFLLYVPLFGRDGVPAPFGADTKEAVGFVYAPFRATDLISRVLSAEPRLDFNVQVYSDAIAPANLLHGTPAAMPQPVTTTISVADRKWVVVASEANLRKRINPSYVVMLIGLVLAGAAAALVNSHLGSVEATERLANERQQHIEQRELMLGEMQHRIKNSIARMLAMFRLTARETDSKPELISAFDNRMQAMARAQTLIVSGVSDARTLSDIVTAEVGQWEKSGARIWSGPEVMLDRGQLQAIGLILHELSTNALKYGALATRRPLSVTWRLEGEKVVLDWREELEGKAAEPIKAGSGFGSRFMRMMVEGQLGGTFERNLTEKLFSMQIRFPLHPKG